MAQLQREKCWAYWHRLVCEQRGCASQAAAGELSFHEQHDLAVLSFWLVENEVEALDDLHMAGDPEKWVGAQRFQAKDFDFIRALAKRRPRSRSRSR